MRVLIVQETFGADGRTKAMVPVIATLNGEKITPIIITFHYEKSDITKDLDYKLVEKKRLFKKTLLKVLDAAWLNFLASRYKADFIINSNNLAFPAGQSFQLIYLHYPREWNLQVKSWQSPFKKSFTSILQRLVLSQIKSVLAISEGGKQKKIETWCNSHFTAELACRLKHYNVKGVSYPVAAKTHFQDWADAKRVITIGRIVKTKRHERLIFLAEQLPEWQFVILGFSEDINYVDELKSEIAAKRLQNVVVKTDVTDTEKQKELERAGIYVHLQDTEPFGIAIVEALEAGCVPIVPDNAGPCEIVSLPELRYNRYQEIADIIRHIERGRK